MASDAGVAVAECHAQAVRQYNTGRPAQSLRTLQRALRLLERAEGLPAAEREALAARIWISRALSEVEVGAMEAGLEALARAEEFATRSGAPEVVVLLHTQRGSVHLRRGNLAAARASFDEAVRLIEHGTPRERAVILLNRGVVDMLDGRLRSSRADLERATAVAADAGLPVEQFKALHNLAYLEFLAGDLPKALRLMDAAAELDADVSRGVWLMDRARVLVDAGLAREADDSLRQATDILRQSRLTHDLAEAILERARCALAMDDVRGARRLAAQARELFGRRGNDRWRRSAELVLLQAEIAGGRRGRIVAPSARRLRDELRGEGLRLPARIAALIAVEAQLATGDFDGAAVELTQVETSRPGDPITGRLHSRYVHARVAAATGDPALATRTVRRGLDELARYQASFGSIDLRTASAVHGRRLAELDIELALASRRSPAVLAAAERARAVSSRLPAVHPPDDPVAADLLAELRQTIESLRAVEQDQAASLPLLRRRRDLERRIVARSWTRAGSGAAARPAPTAQVRAALAERAATMVMYVQVAGRLSAVVVGPRGLSLHDLGGVTVVHEHVRRVRADLDVLAHPQLPAAIRAAVRSSLQRSLGELDSALLTALRVDGPLVVVSTGLLGQLPWASLPSLRGLPLVVAPSATKWHASDTTAAPRDLLVTALVGPALGRGNDEALEVAKAWPGAAVIGGGDATTGALLQAMGSASVLHVAAHGVHQSENPLFSSVRMVDGPVFAHELDQTNRAPEHVVLSACEVGLATIRPGDEALGLASVLLHLGTRSVIAGVARVGDEVAEQTMAAYHRRLAAGADSSVALAEALVEVDADVTPPFVNFGAAWAPDLEATSTVA